LDAWLCGENGSLSSLVSSSARSPGRASVRSDTYQAHSILSPSRVRYVGGSSPPPPIISVLLTAHCTSTPSRAGSLVVLCLQYHPPSIVRVLIDIMACGVARYKYECCNAAPGISSVLHTEQTIYSNLQRNNPSSPVPMRLRDLAGTEPLSTASPNPTTSSDRAAPHSGSRFRVARLGIDSYSRLRIRAPRHRWPLVSVKAEVKVS
jgi:hypothetical protein